nr:MAG TPA: hypothetical protein [Caudoviricetes sp.]
MTTPTHPLLSSLGIPLPLLYQHNAVSSLVLGGFCAGKLKK